MAQACPNCGGFDVSQEADRFHCLNCGNYYTYDDAQAKDGPAPEPLFVPEERTEGAQVDPEPTDHDALAAEAKTGDEGIDAPAQTAEAPPAEAPPAEEAPGGETLSSPEEEPAQG